jgi:hypothetical protein
MVGKDQHRTVRAANSSRQSGEPSKRHTELHRKGHSSANQNAGAATSYSGIRAVTASDQGKSAPQRPLEAAPRAEQRSTDRFMLLLWRRYDARDARAT